MCVHGSVPCVGSMRPRLRLKVVGLNTMMLDVSLFPTFVTCAHTIWQSRVEFDKTENRIIVECTYDSFATEHIDCSLSRSSNAARPFSVRSHVQGQMMYIAESELILFQCYPSVMNLDDLTK